MKNNNSNNSNKPLPQRSKFPTTVGQIRDTMPPIYQAPLGNLYPKKEIGATEKQIGSTIDKAHWFNSTMMKPLSASSITKFYAQAQDFTMAKVPRTCCHKTASSNIAIRKVKVKFHFSPPYDQALRNFEKILCFHNGTMLINNIKFQCQWWWEFWVLSGIDVAQEMFLISIFYTFL